MAAPDLNPEEVVTDLVAEEEHKGAYKRIRNYLAGRVVGATRDKTLLHEVVKCLFCRAKIVAEGHASLVDGLDSIELAQRYRKEFGFLRSRLSDVFEADEEMLLDPESIAFVNGELRTVNFTQPKRDPLGDLYEAFIGEDMRSAEGQFFTPQNAISWLVEAVDPKPGEKVIDPACGAGGFLSYTARRLSQQGIAAKEILANIHGVDKDLYLAKLARAHLALTTLSSGKVLCGDSISWANEEGDGLEFEPENAFDVVLANPPFGTKIVSATPEVRSTYELAHKWRRDKDSGQWGINSELQRNAPPQVLFVERCIRLLKPGGRMGIVLPESLISTSSYGYVVQYLRARMDLVAVIGMPENLFKSSGKGGTHTKTCLVVASKRKNPSDDLGREGAVFMAEAKWCGHDSRGNAIPHDDLPTVLLKYRQELPIGQDHLGYTVPFQQITNNILAPRYYDPEPEQLLSRLERTHDLVSIQELVDEGVLEFSTGHEVGKLAYGTGTIPFVRTSDISNWEIKIDPKHQLSEEIYSQYASKQDVRAGDILMVRDGTYLIGSCAFISEFDEKIVYQSHIFKIRVKDKSRISPYLLLALLTSEPVVRQVKAKRYTQDIIDSIGNRVFELVLPIPKSSEKRAEIEKMVSDSIHARIAARELARDATKRVTQ